MPTSMLYLHTLSPLHAGVGQAAAVIDLPIAREKTTNWPVVPASSLKGVLRQGKDDPDANRRFGSVDAAGEWSFADLRLLCFPARSLYGTFAYVTCPTALIRLQRDAHSLGMESLIASIPTLGENDRETILRTATSVLRRTNSEQVVFEDLVLTAQHSAELDDIAQALAGELFDSSPEKDLFIRRLALVHDDLFTFLTESATEITARVALDSATKTVKPGQLWYEEAVPTEAIFQAPLTSRGVLDLTGGVVRIGGKESVGRGICRLVVGRSGS